MYWPGWWRAIEPAQGHVAGSIFAFFFSLKKLSQLRGAEPATRRWASYEALSQRRGTEPATWHSASYVALSQQGSFELARRQWAQWASKVALSFIIHIPMQSQPYNILNLGQNFFFEGDTYLWAGSGNVKSNIRILILITHHRHHPFYGVSMASKGTRHAAYLHVFCLFQLARPALRPLSSLCSR